jgi:hypothetical protein
VPLGRRPAIRLWAEGGALRLRHKQPSRIPGSCVAAGLGQTQKRHALEFSDAYDQPRSHRSPARLKPHSTGRPRSRCPDRSQHQ